MVDWKNNHLNVRLFYFIFLCKPFRCISGRKKSVTSSASGMLALNTVHNNALYSRNSPRSKCTSRMFCIFSWFLQNRSQHGESKEKQSNYCGGPEESTVPSVVKGTTLEEHVQSNLIAKHLI